jgi:hypothetical protein
VTKTPSTPKRFCLRRKRKRIGLNGPIRHVHADIVHAHTYEDAWENGLIFVLTMKVSFSEGIKGS